MRKLPPITKNRIKSIIQDCEERLKTGLLKYEEETPVDFLRRVTSWRASVENMKSYALEAIKEWPDPDGN